MIFIRVLVLAALIAAATMLFGWISVPVLAAVFAVVVRSVSAPGEAALAALLGWGALLARVAMVPAFSTLLPQIGAIFQVPGAVVAVLSVLLGVLLAWSAARVLSGFVARTVAASV
ncbi:MAG: hypothetical protein H7Z40_08330 [Phycisphaerae bacterium]|nr:hypothetical protein [Gemmatimonadaceae bacterium]